MSPPTSGVPAKSGPRAMRRAGGSRDGDKGKPRASPKPAAAAGTAADAAAGTAARARRVGDDAGGDE